MIESGLNKIYGVWANENSELVITSKLILFYQRKGSDYFSTVQTYKIKGNQFDLFTKAVALFSKSKEKANCKYFCKTRKKWIESGDKLDLQTPIQSKSFSISNSKNSLSISNDNKTFLKFNKINNILTLNFNISKKAEFRQIEKIEICDFKIGDKAKEDSIGKCLTKWKLFSGILENEKENNFTTEIITNKHSYIFTLTNWNNDKILYCRAAKIKSNNNGSVFAQNIRLMRNSNEFTAKMAENNLINSKKNIILENKLYDPQKCVFINGGEEIYWSLKEFSEDEIVLNGCGEEYKYSRPLIENDGYEYFKFKKY